MKIFFYFIIFFIGLNCFSQTIGILKNDSGAYNGYTLFAPLLSQETYLVNNCGEVINKWVSSKRPAASVYLLENGNLLRTGKLTNLDIFFGGVGGKIELMDWDGNLLWEYIYSSSEVTQHHDIYPLPNGNILMLAVTTMTSEEAIQAGRDPSNLIDGKLYNEQILELEPVGTNQANIVWEWNINDHLIQDFDSTKDNFGVIEFNPQLLDINFLNSLDGGANWLHVNSIQYNETLDQIILSSRHLSEVYIIDHSTTTAEAASHTGGTLGKGGDFLYRWGNSQSYGVGTSSDQQLFGQHYPHWIPDGLTDAGKIMIFNNGNPTLTSSVEIINPTRNAFDGAYSYDSTNGYSPATSEWSYNSTVPTEFFSAIVSGAQRLPNGNTLICDGDSGYFFEIDTSDTIVWEYKNPQTSTGILSQGDIPTSNLVFRAHKYSTDYPGFTGKDLTPGDPIELDFDIAFCNVLSVDEYDISNEIQLFPNPTSNTITVNSNLTIDKLEVYDLYGKLITLTKESKSISIDHLASGMYFVKVYSANKIGTKKIIKK
jgi:hypothetical protein